MYQSNRSLHHVNNPKIHSNFTLLNSYRLIDFHQSICKTLETREPIYKREALERDPEAKEIGVLAKYRCS